MEHDIYVTSAYGAAFAALLWLILSSLLKRRRARKQLQKYDTA